MRRRRRRGRNYKIESPRRVPLCRSENNPGKQSFHESRQESREESRQ